MDEQLKRRLVGAAVIMLLAIVIIPLFFEDKSPKDPSALPEALQEQPLAIPRESANSDTKTAEESAPVATAPTTRPKKRKYEVVPLDDAPAKPAPSASEPQEASAEATPAAPTESADYSEEEAEPVASTPQAAPASSPSYEQAKSAIRKPASPVKETQATRPPPKTSAPATKNRPDVTSTGAKKPESTTTAKSTKVNSNTTAKPATPSKSNEVATKKSASTPSATPDKATKKPDASTATKPKKAADSRSWTVQAGTFAEESNARNLVDKLKKRNLSARMYPVEASSGKVYRVTVGSGLDRTQAEKIQKDLASKDGVNGVILQNR